MQRIKRTSESPVTPSGMRKILQTSLVRENISERGRVEVEGEGRRRAGRLDPHEGRDVTRKEVGRERVVISLGEIDGVVV